MTAAKPEQDFMRLRALIAGTIDEELGTGNTPKWMLDDIMRLVQAEVAAVREDVDRRIVITVTHELDCIVNGCGCNDDVVIPLQEIGKRAKKRLAELHPQDEDNLGMTSRTAYRPTYPDNPHPPQQPPTEGGSE